MRIFRFMSLAEFLSFLNGEQIQGKFVKGKACFLEENIPSRKKEPSIQQLTDLKSLKFKSKDFDGQMKELTELISPNFISGDFEGELKDIEYLTLADFISKVRYGATAEVLVEFETTNTFEQECNKVIMAYRDYLIEEIQADGYSQETLTCVSYMLDLINGFQDGIGINDNKRIEFQGVEHVVGVICEQLDKLRWLNRFEHYNQIANTPRAAKVKQEVVKSIQDLKQERYKQNLEKSQQASPNIEGR